MPTYEYKHEHASDCSLSPCFERFESMTAEPLTQCEVCNGPVKRLIGPGSGIIFKGTGFYCKDYPKGKN